MIGTLASALFGHPALRPRPVAPPDRPLPEAVLDRLPDGTKAWPCTPALGRLLADAVLSGRRRVLEFGAGASSCILAAALAAAGGGTLVSVEQDPGWCADAWEDVRSHPSLAATLVPCTVRKRLDWRGVYTAIVTDPVPLHHGAPYDLVLIDAPQHWYGRAGTLHLALPYLASGALIVVDDAGRVGEQRAVAQWLRLYPGLRVLSFDPAFGGRGVCLLAYEPARVHPSASAFLGSAYETLRTRRRIRAELAAGRPIPEAKAPLRG
jgi:predicted O-methyltransferase YrrM